MVHYFVSHDLQALEDKNYIQERRMVMPTQEELRNKEQTYYDDVEVGQDLPPYVIGPMTPTHLFRWSAAIENWHRIHYDQDFSIYHDGLPNILAQGSWKQSVMPQYLKDLCLPNG